MRSSRAFLALAFFLVALTRCNLGPTVKKGTAGPAGELRKLALLPLKVEGQFDRSTQAYLQKALRRELEASGYLVVESKAINAGCTIGGCRDEKLARRFGFDAISQLTVTNVSSHNFLLGIYDSISGRLNLSNAQGAPIVSVENKQRYRGGLIFNPGQIVEGVKSTFEKRSDQTTSLADTFIRTIVQKVPHPASGAEAVAAPAIKKVNFERRNGPDYLFCLEGSPGNSAALLMDNERAALRETRPGRYCAVLPLAELVTAETPVEVELKSDFGVAARQPVMAPRLVGCSLKDVLHLERVKGGLRLIAGCTRLSDATAAASCERELAICKNSTLIVYRAAGSSGPFQKTATLKPAFWRSKKSDVYPEGVYSALAISPNGKKAVLSTIPVKD